jgi:hypothetical protein
MQMNVDLNKKGKPNELKSGFAKNLIWGLLAFIITFTLLRWVL